MEMMQALLQSRSAMGVNDLPLAMAYVPFQKWEDIYDEAAGFQRGTIFCALDKPFLGRELKGNE